MRPNRQEFSAAISGLFLTRDKITPARAAASLTTPLLGRAGKTSRAALPSARAAGTPSERNRASRHRYSGITCTARGLCAAVGTRSSSRVQRERRHIKQSAVAIEMQRRGPSQGIRVDAGVGDVHVDDLGEQDAAARIVDRCRARCGRYPWRGDPRPECGRPGSVGPRQERKLIGAALGAPSGLTSVTSPKHRAVAAERQRAQKLHSAQPRLPSAIAAEVRTPCSAAGGPDAAAGLARLRLRPRAIGLTAGSRVPRRCRRVQAADDRRSGSCGEAGRGRSWPWPRHEQGHRLRAAIAQALRWRPRAVRALNGKQLQTERCRRSRALAASLGALPGRSCRDRPDLPPRPGGLRPQPARPALAGRGADRRPVRDQLRGRRRELRPARRCRVGSVPVGDRRRAGRCRACAT